MPNLIDVLKQYDGVLKVVRGDETLSFEGVTADSRAVKKGSIFAALAGEKIHGQSFIEKALANGAVAILTDENVKIPDHLNVAHIVADSARRALAFFAVALYPALPETVVAVTGTDGKTSTAEFTRQLFEVAGLRAASLGTLGVHSAHVGHIEGTHTTPDPVSLHRVLDTLAHQSIQAVAMEASSHGLHQYRLDAVPLQAAAFTNIARDHLDYHKTDEEYFRAKRRLFDALLPEGGTAVVNAEDVRAPDLSALAVQRGHRLIRFGANAPEFNLQSAQPTPHGLALTLELLGHHWQGVIPLIGRFQAMNILAALGLVHGAGVPLEKLLPHLSQLQGVPGRMQLVPCAKSSVGAVVDYAHTPRALEQALQALRPHVQNQLWVVFGCGGDRDTGKRPLMGEVAARCADHVVITDDNPRSEDPASIRAAVQAAAPLAHNVGDRAEAIAYALAHAKAGDMVLVAGKGHETTQTIGEHILPFNDVEVIRAWRP